MPTETKVTTGAVPNPTGTAKTLKSTAWQIAASQLGSAEVPKGSNWGPAVEKYLKSVGINFPAAWCMAFVYWCTDQAAKEMGVPNPLIKTGGVMAQWNKIPKAMKHTTPSVSELQKLRLCVMDPVKTPACLESISTKVATMAPPALAAKLSTRNNGLDFTTLLSESLRDCTVIGGRKRL